MYFIPASENLPSIKPLKRGHRKKREIVVIGHKWDRQIPQVVQALEVLDPDSGLLLVALA